ncbi:hypothetical protein RB195_008430 [Necator americanus]|uniref:Uncharacterized protein n=1 Tax=Necator americanus TaxID=51031 RepID=A0ABR1CPG5_NECAM
MICHHSSRIRYEVLVIVEDQFSPLLRVQLQHLQFEKSSAGQNYLTCNASGNDHGRTHCSSVLSWPDTVPLRHFLLNSLHVIGPIGLETEECLELVEHSTVIFT